MYFVGILPCTNMHIYIPSRPALLLSRYFSITPPFRGIHHLPSTYAPSFSSVPSLVTSPSFLQYHLFPQHHSTVPSDLSLPTALLLPSRSTISSQSTTPLFPQHLFPQRYSFFPSVPALPTTLPLPSPSMYNLSPQQHSSIPAVPSLPTSLRLPSASTSSSHSNTPPFLRHHLLQHYASLPQYHFFPELKSPLPPAPSLPTALHVLLLSFSTSLPTVILIPPTPPPYHCFPKHYILLPSLSTISS